MRVSIPGALKGPLPALAVGITAVGFALVADATPVYSVRSGHECDSCHVEPLGWANPEEATRDCTLSCGICHVSPAGGGLRTPSGEFYGREALPMFGGRPSDGTNPQQHLPEGYPSEGRYRLGEGFSGWWAGDVDHKTIEDRYGDIDPDPETLWGPTPAWRPS